MRYSIFVQDGDKWVRVYTNTDPVDVATAFLKAIQLDIFPTDLADDLERLTAFDGTDRNGNHGLCCAETSPHRPAKVVTR